MEPVDDWLHEEDEAPPLLETVWDWSADDNDIDHKTWVEWDMLAMQIEGVNRIGGDTWDSCDWCGWWGWLETDQHPVPPLYRLMEYEDGDEDEPFATFVLCQRCEGLDEPPWRPNNRDRIHALLMLNFRPPMLADIDSTHIIRLIAEYLAVNMPLVPDGCRKLCGHGLIPE